MPTELHCAPRSSSCCILGICQLASGNQHVPSPNLLLSGMVFGKATHVRTHPRIASIALNCCSVSFRNKVASPMVLMVATWLQILFCWTLHAQNPSCQVEGPEKKNVVFSSGVRVGQHEVFHVFFKSMCDELFYLQRLYTYSIINSSAAHLSMPLLNLSETNVLKLDGALKVQWCLKLLDYWCISTT